MKLKQAIIVLKRLGVTLRNEPPYVWVTNICGNVMRVILLHDDSTEIQSVIIPQEWGNADFPIRFPSLERALRNLFGGSQILTAGVEVWMGFDRFISPQVRIHVAGHGHSYVSAAPEVIALYLDWRTTPSPGTAGPLLDWFQDNLPEHPAGLLSSFRSLS